MSSTRRRKKRGSLLRRDGALCFYCARRFFTGQAFSRPSIDHVVPLVHGGTNALANLVLACKLCNREKADSMPTGRWAWPQAS